MNRYINQERAKIYNKRTKNTNKVEIGLKTDNSKQMPVEEIEWLSELLVSWERR